MIAALLLGWIGITAAFAQSPATLVSNTEQTQNMTATDQGTPHMQSFTTGSHALGYVVTSVRIRNTETTESYAAAIYTVNSRGGADTESASLAAGRSPMGLTPLPSANCPYAVWPPPIAIAITSSRIPG